MSQTNWHFMNTVGDFRLEAPDRTSYLYFPLVNEAGMVSVVTPTLHGDAKTGQNTFLLVPVSVEDLHLSRAARNFWIRTAEGQIWSATGNSAAQRSAPDGSETVTLEAGLLWQRVVRRAPALGVQAELLSFVPTTDDAVEILQVTLTNLRDEPLTFRPVAAIPIYGRSADNLRDHRHVTSLLHRIRTQDYGVLVKPTLSFDERGHRRNLVSYAVLGAEEDGRAPVAFYPCIEDFIGEGGTLDWPQALTEPTEGVPAGYALDGYEALGGLRFQDITLAPGASRRYILILAIGENLAPPTLVARYGQAQACAQALEATRSWWEHKTGKLTFHTGDARFDAWLRWVGVQPVLRRLCGNSFLPYHDYGRGGRGWRDLWQDQLALLLTEPDQVRTALWHNFAGVRLDGSNATIIGHKPGEFKADRNNIPRVWMDHGAWPWLTTELYIHYTGDLAFLLEEQEYFKDAFTHRAQRVDPAWQPSQGTRQRTRAGEIYRGTLLEHLLVQHLTAFFNVGEHNIIRLEGADWNDGLDMAAQRGESVAFTALYAGNLQALAQTIRRLEQQGVQETLLALELLPLLDTLTAPVDYEHATEKQARLRAYFESVEGAISGTRQAIPLSALAHDLDVKAAWLTAHLRRQEWLTDASGHGWYNGYYDNDGQRVEGEHPLGVRMTLTGQVFTLMSGIATNEQVQSIVQAVNHYLYDERVGGPRLNTDFGEVLLNLGRCFGFAFGHKENGAMFTHMAVMYANALYRRGLVREAHRILYGIYRHVQDFPISRMYPGLPEYVTPRGRGVYPYLTGSASWYLLTLLAEVWGVQGRWGDLRLRPALLREQWDAEGRVQVHTLFAGRELDIVYHNPQRLDYGTYIIAEATLDGAPLAIRPGAEIIIPRSVLTALNGDAMHQLDITLAAPDASPGVAPA